MVRTSWKERDRAQANLDFATGNWSSPATRSRRRLSSVWSAPIRSRRLPVKRWRRTKNNFAPRIGFAFRPFNNSRTVIRGGAGLYYNTLPVFIGFRQMGLTNPPFLLSETFEAAPGRTPSLTLAQPFPGAGAISPNPAITAVDRNIQNSLSQQWNLTVERELLKNLGVRVSYVGNKTSHLPWYNFSISVPERQAPGALNRAARINRGRTFCSSPGAEIRRSTSCRSKPSSVTRAA